jgi:hypothetical protein
VLETATAGPWLAVKLVSDEVQFAAEQARVWLEFGQMVQEMEMERNDLESELGAGLFELLVELMGSIGDEKVEAINILMLMEDLDSLAQAYESKLQEGIALLTQRENWNKRVATAVQTDRYHDMALRTSRSESIRKYRDSYNVAARYAYLAARAYDYETGLPADHPSAANGILTDIVRQRGVGNLDTENQDPEAHIGSGGLAGALARMKANHDALKGQLGFYTAQRETTDFSLRHQAFRIATDSSGDSAWQSKLTSYKVSDLWAEREFRLYCRPFGARQSGVSEPGLVIELPTEINLVKNFFGQTLGSQDFTYDPSQYATKISSVGLYFDGYDSSQLPLSPRAYLIPVGIDRMRQSAGDTLMVRDWNIIHQRIPAPYALTDGDIMTPQWLPATDSVVGGFHDIVRHGMFRAYGGAAASFDENDLTYDTRLVGRSVWNTKWLLIVPGAMIARDGSRDAGITEFINSVDDIRLVLQTYSHGGY